MRILVITRAPWRNDNGLGSTLTDFFTNIKDVDLYGLCMREAKEVSPLCLKNFYFSEQQFIGKIIHGGKVGKVSDWIDTEESVAEKKMYSKAKKWDNMILPIARELLWDLNFWKNSRLNSYLDEVSPDIVFFPDFPCIYAHKVFNYIMSYTKAKGVIYHADDCYTLRQLSFSPLYWIYRLRLRKWVRNSSHICRLHYVISNVQKEDYDKMLGVTHKLLTKFGDFSKEPERKNGYTLPIKLVYTGQLGINRWKSIAIIVDSLRIINRNSKKAELLIYTGTEITKKMDRVLNVPGCSKIMGCISASQIPEVQRNADILVHVESFDLKSRLKVRQSFSTKIVDYMKRGRAILAVGPQSVASIKHLIDNDCAIFADNESDLIDKLNECIDNPSFLRELSERAYNCGKLFHNKSDMQKMLYDDIVKLSCSK